MSGSAGEASELATPAVRVAVIIVNYRTPDLTIQTLASLASELDPERDVALVVDNGGGDDSAELIRRAGEEGRWGWLRILELEQNLGFAGGNNAGIRHIEAEYYLLLNSDTIVRPGAVERLREVVERSDEMAAPRLEWEDGTEQLNARPYTTPLSELDRGARTGPISRILPSAKCPTRSADDRLTTQWASLACMMIHRRVFDEVGLLDDGYFMYFDDIDLCRRARRSGILVEFVPEARVVHLKGGSGPVQSAAKLGKRRPEYYYRARARYFAKFYGTPGLWAANCLWGLGRTVSWTRERVGRKQTYRVAHEGRDIWIGCVSPMSRAAASTRSADR